MLGLFWKPFCRIRFYRNAHLRSSVRSKSVRIGCSSGFYGDTMVSARQLVEKGQLDFLVMDYLSEITMSLLVSAQKKDPSLGYVPDFVRQSAAIKAAKAQGVKVIANAGGINPEGCAAALRTALGDQADRFKIAVISGDNLINKAKQLAECGVTEMDSRLSLPSSTNSMTAYLGSLPIAKALDCGADVVITGRCVDSALALGPLIHTHKWSPNDLDLLASGSLAGHLIECGAQCTGGNFTDWELVGGWDNIGFPIVECDPDGTFTVSKPDGTGGLVSIPTVAEQLIYEIHDPSQYILPDVICDFSDVTLEPTDKPNTVRVKGAKGYSPTHSYKVCATYSDGFRLTAVCCIGGPKSAAKGQKVADSILSRVNGICRHLRIEPITDYSIQLLGSEQTYGSHANKSIAQTNRESVLWLAASHQDKRALEILSSEIAPAGTGMAPGLTAIVGGRPKVSPVYRLFSFLYPKDQVQIDISINGKHVSTHLDTVPDSTKSTQLHKPNRRHAVIDRPLDGPTTYRVGDLAYTRSGDKGNHCNIGVISRTDDTFPVLCRHLTAERVGSYFSHVFNGGVADVRRFELPGIKALNFVLYNSLGGGGIASLRSDPQGKAFGQMLLDLELHRLPSGLL